MTRFVPCVRTFLEIEYVVSLSWNAPTFRWTS